MEIISKSSEQTQKIAEILGRTILESEILGSSPRMPKASCVAKKNSALVLALEGDLGGVKTTFIQGLAKGLGVRETLTSPTFVIMKSYYIPHPSFPLLEKERGLVAFYHLDCYRLKDENDLEALGIKEILADSKNIVAIEWAERVRKILFEDAVKIKFEVIDENTRDVKICNYSNCSN